MLLGVLLLMAVQVQKLMNMNDRSENRVTKQSVINTHINENKYRYCDIIKITSKYGMKINKLYYKKSTWDIVGSINGSLSSVKQSVDLLQKEQKMFDIKSIKGNSDKLNVELEIKIK